PDLPPLLQSFHDRAGGSCASGTVTVEPGAGLLRRALARLLRLPPAGCGLPLRLQVLSQQRQERWIRHFGTSYRLETLQWREGPLLIEKAGILQFAFALGVKDATLTFHQQFCRLW